MDAYTMAVLGLIVLAVVVIGSVLIARNMRKGPMETATGETGVAFRDCYDLGAHQPGKEPSQSFSTMCSHHGGA